MMIKDREFQIFVKPVGPRCNLNCTYCYYLKKMDLYPEGKPIIMSGNILEKYIIQVIEATTSDVINFSWHGGEPLLAGTGFFRRAVELQMKHLPAGKSIMNGIQTNGTLINPEWCRFFKDHHFMIGISIDGPGHLHNRNRVSGNGRPTLDSVLKGYELLRKYNIPVEILCVVNSENVRHPLIVYNFLKELGPGHITFIPLVDRNRDTETGVSLDSVPSHEFGIFLTTIFDEWVSKDIGKLKIQVFEEMIRPAFGQEHTLCIFKKECGGVPILEYNGDFYSCDHYVSKEYLVGNITKRTVSEMLDAPEQESFGKAKSATLPRYCIECPVKNMCNGECPKNRFISTPDGDGGLNYLCGGYKNFFIHCRPFVEAIGEVWRNQNKQF